MARDMRFLCTAIVVALVAGGCMQSDDGPHPTIAGPSTSGQSGTPPRGPMAAPQIALEKFVDGLEKPVFLTHAGDGSDTLYVVEQGGRIKTIKDGKVGATMLDIADQISTSTEQGLLGLAFAPDFSASKRFYIYYTDTAGSIIVATSTVGSNGQAGSLATIIRIPHAGAANHNGGMLTFGPDGKLWLGVGDGGGAGDPDGDAQNKNSLLGKLLRITPTPGGAGCLPISCYTSPADNPFGTGVGAREVWDYGLRNPWRFSFDRETKDLWIADVGQSAWEEVNLERAGSRGGVNWGWNCREGAHSYGACMAAGSIDPVEEYDHGGTRCSITGGYVYRGSQTSLRGWYLFGDYCSGDVWALNAAHPEWGSTRLLDSGFNISSFGEDGDGEVYVIDHDGAIYRVVAS